jgi:cell wall-associated NlpC family hydrolase
VHPQRTSTRRRPRAVLTLVLALTAVVAGVLQPTAVGATPTNAADASRLAREAAQELTLIDEQVHEAKLIVEAQQNAARTAAQQAADAQAALAVFEPQLRAIAQSGYTGKSQSRMAAFLTSDSAEELVQQMTTLDMIAHHTSGVVAEVATAQAVARETQAAADAAAATAQAGLDQLEAQQAEVQKKIDDYQATFARLTAQEQAAVTTALAGPALRAPSVGSLPPAPGPEAATAVAVALGKVGTPYVWGSSGPDGFDCSGLTSYAYGAAGMALPHSSRSQSSLGVEVARADLQPGDLVFYYSPISHVALYIGNGMIVHARTFGQPVAVTTVDQRGYQFAKRIG